LHSVDVSSGEARATFAPEGGFSLFATNAEGTRLFVGDRFAAQSRVFGLDGLTLQEWVNCGFRRERRLR
jgi:hypothetical protein